MKRKKLIKITVWECLDCKDQTPYNRGDCFLFYDKPRKCKKCTGVTKIKSFDQEV